jgi:N-acylneuraminate cytidylyltransferase
MKIVAIIPARAGSKGIPNKNIRLLAGKPLLAHTIEHARQTPAISRIVVSTDGDEIARVAEQYGAEVIRRPAAISGDQASSESALLHALDTLRDTEGYEPDLIVFLQATSPIRQPDDIQNAIDVLLEQDADSLFSANPFEGFVWRKQADDLTSFSYDYRNRQRRQDAPEDLIENGSIYVLKPEVLREHHNRLGGRIAVYRMHPLDSYQIDTLQDLEIIEQIMAIRQVRSSLPELAGVQLLVLDFDGVLTDNRALVDENGKEAVFVNRSDGWGIARLKEVGVPVAVISTETNPVVTARCRKLDIPYVQGVSGDKSEVLARLVSDLGAEMRQVVYVGNDANDLSCLRLAGIPVAVQDARPEVLKAASLVLTRAGGDGAVREICDLILDQRARREKRG